MNAQDCLQTLRDIRDVSFATVDENGMPHSRIIDVMIVEENRLVFCTGRGKDFYRQLTANPHVAISGLNRNWQMIRLTGGVKKLDDQKKWIDRILDIIANEQIPVKEWYFGHHHQNKEGIHRGIRFRCLYQTIEAIKTE